MAIEKQAPEKVTTATITTVGKSAGVIIPKHLMEFMGFDKGDEVELRPRGSVLEIVPIQRRVKLRPEVQAAADRTFEKFGPALERLAK